MSLAVALWCGGCWLHKRKRERDEEEEREVVKKKKDYLNKVVK